MKNWKYFLRKGLRYSAIACAFSGAFVAQAGSLITANLPSGTEIINIDGTNDGAHTYDSDQSNWYQPFATNGILNEVTLGPGTYTFSVVDPTDAHAEFSGLTPAQLATIGSAWSYNSPYTTSYFVFDSSALNNPNESQIFAGANEASGYYYTGEAAYQATKAAGQLSQLYTGPGGRFHGTIANSYTLTQTETLIFVAPDWYLPDNHGIESIVIQPFTGSPLPVPEPTPIAIMGVGCLALVVRRRKRG